LLLEMTLDAVLLERRGVELVRHVREHFEQTHLQTILRFPRAPAHDDRISLLLHDRRRCHPVQRLIAASVLVDEQGSCVPDHEQPGRPRRNGREAAGIDGLAAGDDKTHGPRTVLSLSDRPRPCQVNGQLSTKRSSRQSLQCIRWSFGYSYSIAPTS